MLEDLEINQYIWAILDALRGTEFEEVVFDSSASWRPAPASVRTIKEEGVQR